MSCPACKGKDIGDISFTSIGEMSFRYCRHCEHRWWESGSKTVELRNVLRAAASLPRAG